MGFVLSSSPSWAAPGTGPPNSQIRRPITMAAIACLGAPSFASKSIKPRWQTHICRFLLPFLLPFGPPTLADTVWFLSVRLPALKTTECYRLGLHLDCLVISTLLFAFFNLPVSSWRHSMLLAPSQPAHPRSLLRNHIFRTATTPKASLWLTRGASPLPGRNLARR